MMMSMKIVVFRDHHTDMEAVLFFEMSVSIYQTMWLHFLLQIFPVNGVSFFTVVTLTT
jgi:hypothetical protein